MNERELDLALDRLGVEHVRRTAPSALRDRVHAIPLTTKRRSWLPPLGDRGPQPLFSATRFVFAGAMVALFGGFLLAGILTKQPEETRPAVGATATPEPTTTRPIELPAEIPEGIESGTLETPLGPARWVRLEGNETTLPPSLGGTIGTPDGYAVPEGGGGEMTLWRSPDLISWTPEPLGIEGRSGYLSWTGDTYWLNVSEPDSTWRSADTGSWEQVSVEGLVPPGPDGYAWALETYAPLTYGGVTIVPFEWVTDERVVVDGLPGAVEYRGPYLVETAPGIFKIRAIKGGTFTTVRFEETDDGLRVIDHEDGTELKVLEGVSMEFIKLLTVDVESRFDEIGWAGGAGLAVFDGSALVEVEHPLEAEDAGHQAFSVDDEGFVSYTLAPDGLVHVHRSPDGREWSETDLIGDDADEPTDIERVWTDRGSASVGTSEGGWTSTDGLAWEPDRFADEIPIGTGWILAPDSFTDELWFQPRAGQPVPVDITEMAIPASDCVGDVSYLSRNTIATYSDEGCLGVRNAWIVTVYDVPT